MSDKISHQLKKKCATSSHVITQKCHVEKCHVITCHRISCTVTFHLFGFDHIGHHRIDDFDMPPIGIFH